MAIKLDSGFEILRLSDLNYEEISVEIQYKGEQIAQINKDKGINRLEIEILTDYIDSNFSPKFMLDDFLLALDKAQKLLKEE
jgi:predicted RNA-binding protein